MQRIIPGQSAQRPGAIRPRRSAAARSSRNRSFEARKTVRSRISRVWNKNFSVGSEAKLRCQLPLQFFVPVANDFPDRAQRETGPPRQPGRRRRPGCFSRHRTTAANAPSLPRPARKAPGCAPPPPPRPARRAVRRCRGLRAPRRSPRRANPKAPRAGIPRPPGRWNARAAVGCAGGTGNFRQELVHQRGQIVGGASHRDGGLRSCGRAHPESDRQVATGIGGQAQACHRSGKRRAGAAGRPGRVACSNPSDQAWRRSSTTYSGTAARRLSSNRVRSRSRAVDCAVA